MGPRLLLDAYQAPGVCRETVKLAVPETRASVEWDRCCKWISVTSDTCTDVSPEIWMPLYSVSIFNLGT